MRVHLRTKLAQGQQRGLAYGIIKGRTSIIEMHATDVKTTIFSSEIYFKIIDFHKVLELSKIKIIDFVEDSYLWAHSPFLDTYTYTVFFFFF